MSRATNSTFKGPGTQGDPPTTKGRHKKVAGVVSTGGLN